MTKPVDPMCVELARHFLDDVKFSDNTDVQELAEIIQTACEQYCHEMEDDEQ
jgi:hypothetical protein